MGHSSQKGSAFFYILIAIVLLAALTYSVSRSSRTNTSIISEQQAKVAAQNIIEQGQTVSNAVQKLNLRGFDETQISFENLIDTNYTLASCTTTICRVFDIAGGGLNWFYPPENSNDGSTWIYTGQLPIRFNGLGERYDLTMVLPNINQKTCQEINFKLGLATSNNEAIPVASDTTITINRLATGNEISDSSNFLDGTDIDGNNSICLQIGTVSGDYTGTNQFYYVHTLYAG